MDQAYHDGLDASVKKPIVPRSLIAQVETLAKQTIRCIGELVVLVSPRKLSRRSKRSHPASIINR